MWCCGRLLCWHTSSIKASTPGSCVLQMLVYENYNKFVTATDTIKVMNSSMGGVDTSMVNLKQLIGGAGHALPCWAVRPACDVALVLESRPMLAGLPGRP